MLKNLLMMSSKTDVKEIIFKIFNLLDENNISKEIDSLINKAIDEFVFEFSGEYSHKRFHYLISKLVQFIYKRGLKLPKEISLTEALAEAISLLELGYRNDYSAGYDAAIVDASNPEINGLELIKSALIEIIKNIEQQKYIEWVFTASIDPATWETKCKVIEFLLTLYAPFLPKNIQISESYLFVDSYKELILKSLNTDVIINQLASGMTNSISS